MYPDGYGTREVTLEQMVAKHGGKMHPEFRRRFFAYIESQGGFMGVGGGWRDIQPTKPGFAPDGKSFHQDQRFASGIVGYAAVDLVVRQPGQVHRSPYWRETATAPDFGLHTFIKSPDEPWHIQCIEMRGWQTWVNAGRPDPARFPLPGEQPPPITHYERIAMSTAFEFARATRWDTRGFGNPLPAGEYVVKLDGSAGKVGATVNLTITQPTGPGYASAWPSGPRPNTSKVNYAAGQTIANEESVPLAADGSFKVYIHSPAHIVIDLVGYWLA